MPSQLLLPILILLTTIPVITTSNPNVEDILKSDRAAKVTHSENIHRMYE